MLCYNNTITIFSMKFKKIKPKFGSFGADGFMFALKNERHIRWYILYTCIFILSAVVLDFPRWLYFEGIIFFVILIILELINTAFEILCDFVVDGKDLQIKRVKDLGAAAVFVHGFFAGGLLLINLVYFLLIT